MHSTKKAGEAEGKFTPEEIMEQAAEGLLKVGELEEPAPVRARQLLFSAQEWTTLAPDLVRLKNN